MKITKSKTIHPAGVDEYVAALKKSRVLGGQVVCHRELKARTGDIGHPENVWPAAIENLLEKMNISEAMAGSV